MGEERLVNIETILAYQDDTIQQLNDLVYEQQKQIDLLSAKFQKLEDQMKSSVQVSSSRTLEDDIPPHY